LPWRKRYRKVFRHKDEKRPPKNKVIYCQQTTCADSDDKVKNSDENEGKEGSFFDHGFRDGPDGKTVFSYLPVQSLGDGGCVELVKRVKPTVDPNGDPDGWRMGAYVTATAPAALGRGGVSRPREAQWRWWDWMATRWWPTPCQSP
jgi:hypothetical protein